MDLLSHMETFVAAAEQRNFTRAADQLAIPQPLLSRRIKALEREWATALFDRSRRQVELTPRGALLLPYAQDVVNRVRHLETVLISAGASVVHAIGVPAECSPAALARVIRVAGEHGLRVEVRELPPRMREAGLADGALAVAVVRAAAAEAAETVRMGLGSATAVARGPAHLDTLRPRRATGRVGAHSLLVGPEDDLDLFRDPLRHAIARAGLPESIARDASSITTAVAEVLAGRAMLLCDRSTARRHQLEWAPLAERTLDRGYRIAPGRGSTLEPAHVEWLAPLLQDAVADTGPLDEGEADFPSRLAASG